VRHLRFKKGLPGSEAPRGKGKTTSPEPLTKRKRARSSARSRERGEQFWQRVGKGKAELAKGIYHSNPDDISTNLNRTGMGVFLGKRFFLPVRGVGGKG